MAFTPLNSLNAFLAVARRLSYAAAARDLGVSTSALSQSVRQLEERLEVSLLTRTSRNVALTETGRRLLESAGPAVDQAMESLRTVKARRGEVTGRVRLTVPSVSVTLVLAELLPRFVIKYPKVQVEVHVDDRLVNTVAGEFDAGIRLVESIDRDMVHVRLTAPTRVVVTGAPSYLTRKGVPQTPQELLHHDCICIRRAPSGESWAWELERRRKTYRVPVAGPITTNDADLMHALAIAGVGLFYSLEDRVQKDLASGRLRLVLERYAPTVPGLYLYYPSRSQVSPALKAFVELARAGRGEGGCAAPGGAGLRRSSEYREDFLHGASGTCVFCAARPWRRLRAWRRAQRACERSDGPSRERGRDGGTTGATTPMR